MHNKPICKNGFILCKLDKLSKNALFVLTMWACCGTIKAKNAQTGGKKKICGVLIIGSEIRNNKIKEINIAYQESLF
jgi:hypothetical protein